MNANRVGILCVALLFSGFSHAEAEPSKGAKQFCYEGKCINRINDSHAPQYNLNYPILSTNNLKDKPLKAGDNVIRWTVPSCDGKSHDSPWYTVGPDASQLFVVQAPDGCEIQSTTWNRNHWTMTCWTSGFSDSYTNYECHNWNTVWGDSWQVNFVGVACPSNNFPESCASAREKQ